VEPTPLGHNVPQKGLVVDARRIRLKESLHEGSVVEQHRLHAAFSHLHGQSASRRSPVDLENSQDFVAAQCRRLFATEHGRAGAQPLTKRQA
jgi:hypothetical protein